MTNKQIIGTVWIVWTYGNWSDEHMIDSIHVSKESALSRVQEIGNDHATTQARNIFDMTKGGEN